MLRGFQTGKTKANYTQTLLHAPPSQAHKLEKKSHTGIKCGFLFFSLVTWDKYSTSRDELSGWRTAKGTSYSLLEPGGVINTNGSLTCEVSPSYSLDVCNASHFVEPGSSWHWRTRQHSDPSNDVVSVWGQCTQCSQKWRVSDKLALLLPFFQLKRSPQGVSLNLSQVPKQCQGVTRCKSSSVAVHRIQYVRMPSTSCLPM